MQLVAHRDADYQPVAYGAAMEQLLNAVQQLSLARQLDQVTGIVRTAARSLTGAQGATFVLKEGDFCFYADEDAIEPLWKGRRFPLEECVSGWSMLNRQPAVIEDIYRDSRVPADAYRPTFVKSLVMVPIRSQQPIGAIGVYWANRHKATNSEVKILQALADSTSVAMENVAVYGELEQRVRARTIQLESVNRELESFTSSVAHDLRAPLGVIEGYCSLLTENFSEGVPEAALKCIRAIPQAAMRMRSTIDALLTLARLGRGEIELGDVDLSSLAESIAQELRDHDPERQVTVQIEPGLHAVADRNLLCSMLQNLLENAWKYTSKTEAARIEVGRVRADGGVVYFVRDNGAGFNPADKEKLFVAFGRLHSDSEFPGIGIGLATVQRIVERHGGRVWADGTPGRGATFYFTLP